MDKDVTQGATAIYSVTYNFIPLSPSTDDLCADQKEDKCPLLASAHHHSVSTSPWPTGLSGTVVSKIEWKDQDGQQVLCLKWTAKV